MGGLAVTGVINDGRPIYNGAAIIAPPLATSGTYQRRVVGISSGVAGMTTSQTLGFLAVKYSGKFDDPRYYSGDNPA